MPLRRYAIATAVLALAAGRAWAGGDIVYAGRHYFAPGTRTETSRTRSRFHLFRIDPDGSGRRQITRGLCDDTEPRWSPDGRWIAFLRSADNPEGIAGDSACLVRAAGGPVRKLVAADRGGSWRTIAWSPDGAWVTVLDRAVDNWRGRVTIVDPRTGRRRAFASASEIAWSPDGRRLAVADGDRTRLVDPRTGRVQRIPEPLSCPAWIARDAIAGAQWLPRNPRVRLAIVDRRGRLRKRVDLRWNVEPAGPSADNERRGLDALLPMPGDPNSVICCFDAGTSGRRPYNYYVRVSLLDGGMRGLADGQFLAWSPAHDRILTAPSRELVRYDANRYLYMAALELRRPYRHAAVPIGGGRIWVVGADWRRSPKNRR